MNEIESLLGSRVLFFDGAMGTMLTERGLEPGASPETRNLERPDEILAIHRAYLAAGADLIKTNTFGANRFKFGAQAQKLVSAGVELARAAVRAEGHGLVALDIGPSGKLIAPLGDLDFEDAVAAFAECVRAGSSAGADLVLIETMADLYEAKAAVVAAKENCELPIFVSVTADQDGKLLTGGDLSAMAAVLSGLNASALGLNCGFGPEPMIELTRELRKWTDLPIFINPNAGLPTKKDHDRFRYDVDPRRFADLARFLIDAGAWIVGGCCGTTPEHIRALHETLCDLALKPIPAQKRTVVSSGTKSVSFSERPVIIGERLNPTGKPRLKRALKESDLSYLLNLGLEQQAAGADLLDVNAGLPELDEKRVIGELVCELQAITPLPLSIDTGDPQVLEATLRRYNGKALINSVSAKRASMETIFPIARKYGGVVVGLTITDEGIPETAQGRLDAARTIVETARRYGISENDLLIDPLTMAISADERAAQITLDALKLIRETLGVNCVLGVSNVSFGLPERERVTAAFFTMALERGLSAAIVNPNSRAVMSSYRAFCALKGFDPHCLSYIASAAPEENNQAPVSEPGAVSLREAVEKGLKDQAFTITKDALLRGEEPLQLIDCEIVSALNAVGERFEAKTLYLPQLLMSAEAAKAAFEAIKRSLADTSDAIKKPLPIVLATVRGDVHDIGKNIVKSLLENYGFPVFDLGRDVPPEKVLDCVQKTGATLVGLSALMTTTLPAMKETIELLHQKAPGCRIMVGGAVLTQDYADSLGADHYGKDAMSAVRYAQSLIKSGV